MKFGGCLFNSKVSFHGEKKLIYENLLESRDVILLIEEEHCFLIVNGIDCAERDRTIAIGN